MDKVKNKHAQALGRLGGQKGGFARAAKLSPERRSEIARQAIATRWAKRTLAVPCAECHQLGGQHDPECRFTVNHSVA